MPDHCLNRPAFSRLPLAVDLPLLLQALAGIADSAWKAHFNARYYQGEWSGVALVSADDAPSELAPGVGQAVQRAPWQQDDRWARALDLPWDIRSARLLRLGPGGHIHEHRDYDLDGPQADLRVHIPLLSPPGVDFLLDGLRIPLSAGECWFLDLARPHSVDNWGESQRIHLVLDCRPGPWLEQQVAAGLATTPAPGQGRAARAFEDFCRLLEEDPQLCQALQGLEDSEAFSARTLELAAARGLAFSREHLRAAMRHGRSRWNQQWRA